MKVIPQKERFFVPVIVPFLPNTHTYTYTHACMHTCVYYSHMAQNAHLNHLLGVGSVVVSMRVVVSMVVVIVSVGVVGDVVVVIVSVGDVVGSAIGLTKLQFPSII